MVVKAKRGRRRYIAFETQGESTMEDVSRAILQKSAQSGMKAPKLIQFEGRRGIIRCGVPEKDRIVLLVQNLDINGDPTRTLRTSGTLKTLRDRYFVGVERPARKSAR